MVVMMGHRRGGSKTKACFHAFIGECGNQEIGRGNVIISHDVVIHDHKHVIWKL